MAWELASFTSHYFPLCEVHVFCPFGPRGSNTITRSRYTPERSGSARLVEEEHLSIVFSCVVPSLLRESIVSNHGISLFDMDLSFEFVSLDYAHVRYYIYFVGTI